MVTAKWRAWLYLQLVAEEPVSLALHVGIGTSAFGCPDPGQSCFLQKKIKHPVNTDEFCLSVREWTLLKEVIIYGRVCVMCVVCMSQLTCVMVRAQLWQRSHAGFWVLDSGLRMPSFYSLSPGAGLQKTHPVQFYDQQTYFQSKSATQLKLFKAVLPVLSVFLLTVLELAYAVQNKDSSLQ